MERIDKLVNVLKSLGLWKAIKGFPSLIIPVVLSAAILEMLVTRFDLLAGGSPFAIHLSIILVSVLLGLIGYFAGDFWDSTFFGPRYSISEGTPGKWLEREKRPFHIFPAGADLKRARTKAIEAGLSEDKEGTGVYRRSKTFISNLKVKWEWIEQPLILSKFVRTFIWPAFLICLVCIIGLIAVSLFGLAGNISMFLVIGAFALVLALLLFIPYTHLRIEHMIRLYELAACEKVSNGE